MKTTLNTPAMSSTTTRSHVSFGLTLAGIVTAIFCSVTMLYDGYSTTSQATTLPTLLDASAISGISKLATPVYDLIANLGNKMIGIAD